MDFTSRRSPVLCTHGCAASSQPLASEIGLRVLRAGGNAADACVAMAAALNVAEPCMTGIGGDAFCLFFDAKSKSVRGLNGSGRCPAALDLAAVRAAGQTGAALDASSVHCITTPGAAAAWVDTIERFGRLPLADVLAPAIALAEDGVPVNVVSAACWQAQEEQLKNWPHNPGVAQFLPNGRAPRAGEVLAMPELAATFRALAAEGKPGFYGGRVARAIAEAVAANGGRLSEADLAAHVSTFDDPLCVEFEGVRVWELPPNGQGIVALLALQTLRARLPELRRAAHNSAEYLHLLAEALRLAFADAAAAPSPTRRRRRRGLHAARRRVRARARRADHARNGDADGGGGRRGAGAPRLGHRVPVRRRRRWQRVLVHQLELHGLWERPRARRLRLHAAQPRRQLFARRRPPECARPGEAAVPHDHSRHADGGGRRRRRRAGGGVWRDGRLHAAAGSRPAAAQLAAPRNGPAGCARRAAPLPHRARRAAER